MKKMWGGRFREELAPEAKKFSFSLHIDGELLACDIEVSSAHARMLGKAGLIKKNEALRIVRGLHAIEVGLKKQDLRTLADEYEDVHALIEDRLADKIGPLARKLHTGRSRNDLVATSTKLYLKRYLIHILEALNLLQNSIVQFADRNQGVVMPGYTHMQRAQVVLLAHHLLAFVEMFDRDKNRITDVYRRLNESPLGSGALAGSSLALDRETVAKDLGFKRPTANSIDSVSDRDFILETLAAFAILFVHLSRLCEDFILWNSSEFGFVVLADRYATGSSLMPQKKNPDLFELTRGRTGAIIGHLTSLLITMKGLPLSYNRDMQEDKKPLFESLNIAREALVVVSNTIRHCEVRDERCRQAASDGVLYATDLLEYLILKGMVFRDAHELVGKMIQEAGDMRIDLKDFTLAQFQKYSELVGPDVYEIFDPFKSVARKRTLGSTNPEMVSAEIRKWKKKTIEYKVPR